VPGRAWVKKPGDQSASVVEVLLPCRLCFSGVPVFSFFHIALIMPCELLVAERSSEAVSRKEDIGTLERYSRLEKKTPTADSVWAPVLGTQEHSILNCLTSKSLPDRNTELFSNPGYSRT